MARYKNPLIMSKLGMPGKADLDRIPVSQHGEFEMSQKEIKDTRVEIYKINKDNIRKFRTVKDGNKLMIWRIK